MNSPDWYSPDSIDYSSSQIIWLMPHLQDIKTGFWPPRHSEVGYSGSSKGRVINKEAKFTKPCIVAAELEVKIEKQGLDGILLEYIYSNPQNYYENVQHVANALRVPTDEIFQRMRKTLERMTQ
ncbi:hypothetical protein LCGC14_1505340 [marine sediment metagenome]|uniref:Uncharacterized protein n=1 Tax=marine sediment metagenome TaxID=412755 RepID=A0A0F9J2X3_9ZZZZ